LLAVSCPVKGEGRAGSMTTAAKQRITVSSGLRGSDNAFGVLRLFFATLVIFSHAFPLSGFGKDGLFLLSGGKESIGGVAVIGFFIISGYLITKSGSRNDVLQFLWRRALRIFPAFWVALIVGAFGVAFLAWLDMGRPAGAFFTQ